jgi:SMC interacting uncharacterized protein involved in chromosome segregation
MENITLREYAKRHKLSFFNVMKMVRSGAVKSITKNGKEYIVLEEEREKEIEEVIANEKNKPLSLEEENKHLKEEVAKLQKALEKCNKRTVLA